MSTVRPKTPARKLASKRPASVLVQPPTRQKKRDTNQFYTYIHKVLKQVHPDTGINTSSIQVVNALMMNLIYIGMMRINHLCMLSDRKTISSREVSVAFRSILPGELAKHAVSDLTKAVTKFVDAKKGTGVRTEMLCGLQFSVSRVENMMRSMTNKRITESAPVAFAAVLEYLCAEILELAGNAAKDFKRKRISRRDIMLCIYSDEEIMTLIESFKMTVPGGIMPNIRAEMLPVKKTPKQN